MNVLVIGSGGREHAIAWKLRQSNLVGQIYCAPGNPGMESVSELVPLPASDYQGLLRFAIEHDVELTVVGPEQPLIDGIVDLFNTHGLSIFGPTGIAAQLEGSKSFAKDFMARNGIPTAEYRVFEPAQIYDAERYINEVPVPIVIKADGLAAGKGVVICETKDEAVEWTRNILQEGQFGKAGSRVVIEEFLAGEEASVLVMTDGERFVTLPAAQDHKRIFDNDQGKNTGGMGAYAPASVVTDGILDQIERRIIRPTLDGMRREGHPYRGCLYAGVMITETGPRVVEFNCRFGDPETQAVLPLLDDDFAAILLEASTGKLTRKHVGLKRGCAVCVVIASGGYPDTYETGRQIFGLDSAGAEPGVMVFHAGTKRDRRNIVTSGGRVLGVTAVDEDGNLESSIARAYRVVQKITFDGAYYRSDIGQRGLARLRQIQQQELP
jgi:phosphoribosylamine--glycine ligase